MDYGSGLSSFNVLKTFNWSSYFLAYGKSFYSFSTFNFSKCEKGSFSLRHNRMATVTFFFFSNAQYFNSVICQKKLSVPRMTC